MLAYEFHICPHLLKMRCVTSFSKTLPLPPPSNLGTITPLFLGIFYPILIFCLLDNINSLFSSALRPRDSRYGKAWIWNYFLFFFSQLKRTTIRNIRSTTAQLDFCSLSAYLWVSLTLTSLTQETFEWIRFRALHSKSPLIPAYYSINKTHMDLIDFQSFQLDLIYIWIQQVFDLQTTPIWSFTRKAFA